jgi:uncharacterized membrane protein YoaK (UPF0700 family)
LKGAIAMLILGIIIGLLTGLILGLALSFPLGSAFGMIIDRFFNGWAIEIEIALVAISMFMVFRLLNLKWKNS